MRIDNTRGIKADDIPELMWVHVSNKTNLSRALDCLRDIVVIDGVPIEEDKLKEVEELLTLWWSRHF